MRKQVKKREKNEEEGENKRLYNLPKERKKPRKMFT